MNVLSRYIYIYIYPNQAHFQNGLKLVRHLQLSRLERQPVKVLAEESLQRIRNEELFYSPATAAQELERSGDGERLLYFLPGRKLPHHTHAHGEKKYSRSP